MPRSKAPLALLLLGIALCGALATVVYQAPFVQDRLGWRVAELRARVKYALSPPQESVFTPNPTVAAIVKATLAALTPTPTPSATPGPTAPPGPTSTPTADPTPLPQQVQLDGIRHEYQQWNNCGPANLSMALSFWGWQGNQSPIAAYTKPNSRDKNVMPYELADFVETQTELDVVVRFAGDLALLKRFIAAGYPVLVEKGFDVPGKEWMGHYQLITGYDDARQRFTAQDSYQGGPNLPVTYQEMATYWRHFNYTYLILYPPDRRDEVMGLLGPHADRTYNLQAAAQRASDEIFSSRGRQAFFAWFNRGTSLMSLQDYAGAAAAYDEAFQVYAGLEAATRPWRIMWYQTGPYWAYYYTGRYYDVINLATQTLDNMSEPVLEESFYWRALALEALGDVTAAIRDYRMSLEVHPAFQPSLAQLERLGASP